MRPTGNQSLKLLVYGMSTGSLMIWSLMLSRAKEVMYGHAETMMGMSRVISWPKVYVIYFCSGKLIFFPQALMPGYMVLGFGSLDLMTYVLVERLQKQRLPMAQLQDISGIIRREGKPALIV